MRSLDLTGQKFGKLTVLHRAPNQGRRTMWECECECGNITEVRTENLKNGHTTSCGCKKREPSKRSIDLTGEKFGEWTVLSKVKNRESYWLCECSCGVQREVYAPSLKKGKSLSCGHLFRNQVRKPIIGKRYGQLTVLSQIKEGDDWYCKCKCDCGNITTIKRSNLTSGNTQSCGCIQSKGEARIKRLLQEKNIPFVTQWTPKDYPNQKCKFDFWVNNKYAIEFDGPQHNGQVSGYYTQEKVDALIQRDREKNQYCLEHNIPLYRIPYSYRDTITYEELTNEKFRVKKMKIIKETETVPDMEEAQEEI